VRDWGTVAKRVGTFQRATFAKRVSLALFAAFVSTSAHAEQLLGQPTPGGFDMQPAGDALKRQVIFFHDDILMPIIVSISLFVLGLLIYVAIKFNRKANPTPAQFTHNTTIEVAWTAAPVVILMFIAIFSFRLLYAYHDMPKPDLTVKVTGNQWYWSYAYPDQGGFNFDSNMLPEDKAKASHVPYRLAVDNPMVVPVGKVVRVLVTGADVIHDFANPAFGLKTDAVPGKVNETWFKAEKPGIYYGQCSELCGVNHAFMPIEIDVVDQGKFNTWVGARGGKLSGAPVSSGSGGSETGPAPAAPDAGAKALTGKGLVTPPTNTTASTTPAKISLAAKI
jgi:cytochrome c oxidase subunit 2